MSAPAKADTASLRSPGVALLWVHVALYTVVAGLGYFAMELLFSSAVIIPAASVPVKWLSAALLILAMFMAMAARSGSHRQVRVALLGAFLFALQAPIIIASYPGIIDHFETDLGLDFRLVPVCLFLLVGITAFELSRVWRASSAAAR